MTMAIMGISSAAAAATSAPVKTIQEIMSKPLITGASVSADWLATSPGKVLALRYTSKDNIKVKAKGGKPSFDTVAFLNEKDFSDRTAIIAIDAFFWDSVRASPDSSLKVLNELVERAAKLNIPLVLGEIPALLPAYQPSANAINKAMAKACSANKGCYVLPFDSMVKELLFKGFIEINGKPFSLFDLLPDGLHMNSIASNYLADRIEALLKN